MSLSPGNASQRAHSPESRLEEQEKREAAPKSPSYSQLGLTVRNLATAHVAAYVVPCCGPVARWQYVQLRMAVALIERRMNNGSVNCSLYNLV